MGCSQSVGPSRTTCQATLLPYPSAVVNEKDAGILDLWNKYLRGDCQQWKAIVSSGKSGKREVPATYWSNTFKNNMVRNMSTVHPYIAAELASRPIMQSARILCGIMEFCLVHTITCDEDDSVELGATATERTQRRDDQLCRIAWAHCKWDVCDADYIIVENAMMDALRTCLGIEFTPEIEVRLRYKYGKVKAFIIEAQGTFEREDEKEAKRLRSEGYARIEHLRTTEDIKKTSHVMEYTKIGKFSVADFNTDLRRGD